MRGLVALVAIGLTIYALIDCVRADNREVQGLPKPVWLLVILLLPIFGPLSWVLLGRARFQQGPPSRPRGPVAPDDDPEFLRRLEEHKRQQAEDERLRKWEEELRRREQGGGPAGGGPAGGGDRKDGDSNGGDQRP